jgi:glycosyltransferase involved in cell wall biosynthesis
MRIAFADFCNWDFHVQTVDSTPMGGSQSAACYLARALAKLGHEVFLISSLSVPGIYDGVTCLSWARTPLDSLASMQLDAFICILGVGKGGEFRKKLGSQTRLILWNHHAANEPGVQGLRNPVERDVYDGIAMVSQWQRGEFLQAFGINPIRTSVMRNAIPPAFANQFAGPILPQKTWPPILAYTSTPFRGLGLLLEAFGRIRERIPGTRLQVFSSMKVYRISQAEDEAHFGRLYQLCRETDGVEYIGSIPQPELARALRNVTMLAYPNTFPETSCIAVMEAMASGCQVVTSALGALPETTAGFARLISLGQNKEAYLNQFIEQVVAVLGECQQRGNECERFLQRQVEHVNSNVTWDIRAGEWVQWLHSLPRPT